MINTKEEMFHDSKVPDFQDTYRLHTISKRDKWYSYTNITLDPHTGELGLYTLINFSDTIVSNNQIIKNPSLKKTFGTTHCKYSIIEPLKESRLNFKESPLSATITFFDSFPYYESLHNTQFSSTSPETMINSYCTRSRTKVSVELSSKTKTVTKHFDCIGFREHSWGLYPYSSINCDSRVTVHFRDQSIMLRYLEYNGISYSYGCISRKSGNLAVVLVELEFLSLKNSVLESSEFTYKDAQDDIDLIVSKPIKSQILEVPKKVTKTHTRVISFSDFTVIGTNKKGYGFEEHYISYDRLKKAL